MSATPEPSCIVAGDTVAWRKVLPAYPASEGWVLAYALINAARRIDITSSAAGADHQVNLQPSTTAGYVADAYEWVAVVTRAGERHTVGRGQMRVQPDLMAASAHDGRTSARKALDAVNAAMETYGNKAYLQSYQIAGRSQSFRSPSEFMAFRSQLMAEVRREEMAGRLAAGMGGANMVGVRFNTR
ncbi:hypothetical protein [Pseudorhodoferax sp. Leaf274]|uniref:hypothetical protein n=1 Tax=Pseudorhodoferax sp. Leaf274 TaxID=1736318 RepID=UPI000702F876|nr:hypothetical protein [Pseudorhodoferax sp. Leaf274]KQP39670.1 hypothetical protein ASF44_08025 [Pseudorhodoferax sp. Leaf274]